MANPDWAGAPGRIVEGRSTRRSDKIRLEFSFIAINLVSQGGGATEKSSLARYAPTALPPVSYEPLEHPGWSLFWRPTRIIWLNARSIYLRWSQKTGLDGKRKKYAVLGSRPYRSRGFSWNSEIGAFALWERTHERSSQRLSGCSTRVVHHIKLNLELRIRKPSQYLSRSYSYNKSTRYRL